MSATCVSKSSRFALTVLKVQLTTTHDVSFNLPPGISSGDGSAAPKILALVEDEEGKYQISLNETYQEMSEKTFKSLRRALPMTRSKLDWDKVRAPLAAVTRE